jgi:predicted transcriptional regulator
MTASETLAMAKAEGVTLYADQAAAKVRWTAAAVPSAALKEAIVATKAELLACLPGGRRDADPHQRSMPLLRAVPDSDAVGSNGHTPDRLTEDEKLHTFRAPNVLRTRLLHVKTGLGDAELRVYVYLVGHAMGYHRSSDAVSLKQIVHGVTRADGLVLDTGTGLGLASVKRALNGLIARGLITRTRNTDARHGHTASTYSINVRAGEE